MISNLEKIIFSLVSIVFLILVSWNTQLRWYAGQMDNLLAVSVVDNINKYGKPIFQEVGLREALSLIAAQPDKLCTADLSPPKNDFDSIFKWHAYLILFLIAPFARIFSTVGLLSAISTFSFYVIPACTYIFLRKKKVSPLLAISFICLVLAHPAWSQGLLGQLYVDRLFLGSFFVLILLVDLMRQSTISIIIVSIICALINDRLGLICGGFILGYTILFFKETNGTRKSLLTCSILLIIFSILVMKFLIENQYYGSFFKFLSPDATITNLKNDTFRHNLYIYLFVNFALFGFLSTFRWQAFLLASILMLPNIFGSVGGAEKIGWSTHYHTTYLPVLVWATASGFIVVYHYCKYNYSKTLLSIFVLSLAALQIALPINAPLSLSLDITRFQRHSLVDNIRDLRHYYAGVGSIYSHKTFGDAIKTKIPKGSSLSAPENVMPLLYDHVRLFYYPIGMTEADYVLLPFNLNTQGERQLLGLFTYQFLQPDQVNYVRSCFKKRLETAGYDLDNPPLIWRDWVLLKRRK